MLSTKPTAKKEEVQAGIHQGKGELPVRISPPEHTAVVHAEECVTMLSMILSLTAIGINTGKEVQIEYIIYKKRKGY